MYTVGVFYAWDWLAIIGITIAYLLCPKRFIEEKPEYVKLFLFFLSGYFFLFLIISNLLNNREFTHHLLKVCSMPALFVFHWLYPFKKTRKNQHLGFFLFWAALYGVGLTGVIIILHALFGNTM
jgi:hypothetical protein